MIRVAILDDHELVREGLARLLASDAQLRVVASCSTSRELQQALGRETIDLLLLDINLPGVSGLELLKQFRHSHPALRVLVVSMHPDEQYGLRALRAGACGYLSKSAPANEILQAVRTIFNSGYYVAPSVAAQLAGAVGFVPDASSGDQAPHTLLSDREYELMLLLAEGIPVSQAAERMRLSINTINSYRRRLLNKLSMASNAELMRYCLQQGLTK